MSDLENEGAEESPEAVWAALPLNARKAVYETLRETAARFERDVAQARLIRLSGPTPNALTAVEIAMGHLADGHLLLASADPLYCDNCAEPHQANDPTAHKDKKDLS